MTKKPPRRPGAFVLSRNTPQIDSNEPKTAKTAPKPEAKLRQPRAITDKAIIEQTAPQDDPFSSTQFEDSDPPLPPRRMFSLMKLLLSALGMLLSMALWLWVDQLIASLFARSDILGWVAVGLAALVGFALVAIIIREMAALWNLSAVTKLQAQAANVLANHEVKPARLFVNQLCTFLKDHKESEAARANMARFNNEIIDAADLLAIAEKEILGPLDEQAKRLIVNACKRISIVTAASPRAFVDMAYVIFESGRLISRLSVLYGGRPGTLGFFRLTRCVLAHLAITGSMAIGDNVVATFLGHGLAARISARLGEGLINATMTARIAIAAMETVRPMPFNALERPGISDIMATLVSFTKKPQDVPSNNREAPAS